MRIWEIINEVEFYPQTGNFIPGQNILKNIIDDPYPPKSKPKPKKTRTKPRDPVQDHTPTRDSKLTAIEKEFLLTDLEFKKRISILQNQSLGSATFLRLARTEKYKALERFRSQKTTLSTKPEKIFQYASDFPNGTIKDAIILVGKKLQQSSNVDKSIKYLLRHSKYQGQEALIKKHINKALSM